MIEEILREKEITIYRSVSNHYRTNTYVVISGLDALIVDPGFDITRKYMVKYIYDRYVRSCENKYIFNTHGHLDHSCANMDFKDLNKSIIIMIHRADAYLLEDYTEHDLIRVTLGLYDYAPELFGSRRHSPDMLLEDNARLNIGDVSFLLIHSPGHTLGSSVLYSPELDLAFTGDVILNGGIGRIDLPHSNPSRMIRSIRRLLNTFTDSTLVLPGHGEPFKFGEQRSIIATEVESLITETLGLE
ncbi:MAG: MBL fold metallo-hydrolase [Crenarchaeota archaeon]|nr:MBL fold metallo-hydrolase [Thermoproteota archaeon]